MICQILRKEDYDDRQSLMQFWRILCRDVGTEIDNILTSSSSSSSSIEMIPSNDVAELKAKLAEAQEDLLRDEDIFADKLSEIKRQRKQLKEYEAEINVLRSEIEMMKSSSVPFGEITGSISSPSRQKLYPKSPSRGTALNVAIDSQEDLELSQMIDMHEPDMSQLIEDLEIVNQEKEVQMSFSLFIHPYPIL